MSLSGTIKCILKKMPWQREAKWVGRILSELFVGFQDSASENLNPFPERWSRWHRGTQVCPTFISQNVLFTRKSHVDLLQWGSACWTRRGPRATGWQTSIWFHWGHRDWNCVCRWKMTEVGGCDLLWNPIHSPWRDFFFFFAFFSETAVTWRKTLALSE